jgi:imidazoleglycerol phosphate dehydratase HisB
LDIDGTLLQVERWVVGKVVSVIGKAAGMMVDERTKSGKTVRKFASAHDLRRAFAVRWAGKVMPTVLRELMRHASIATTLAYYGGQNAEATADALWDAVGNTLGNTTQSQHSSNEQQRSKHSTK